MTFEAVLEIFSVVVNGHMICDLHENREVLKRKSSCSITRDCKIGRAELAAKPNSMSSDYLEILAFTIKINHRRNTVLIFFPFNMLDLKE